jgi:HAD superfamily hydrolase (TIGR01509 family)
MMYSFHDAGRLRLTRRGLPGETVRVGFSKPDPRIYALICTRLNVPPEEMVFVDDSDVCVAGARDVGIHAVRYQSNAQAIAEIEKLLTSP